MKDKTRVFLNSTFVFGATILDKVVFFVINIIVARYLLVESFGEYTTALSYATFFSIFISIGLNQTLVRAVNKNKNMEREYLATCLVIESILSLIVYCVLVGSLFFTNYNTNTIYLTLILGIVRILNEYMVTLYTFYDSREKFSISVFLNSSFSLSFLLGNVIVVLYKGNYFHIAFVRLGIILLFVIITILFTIYEFRPKLSLNTIKTFMKQAIPFGISTVFSNMIQRTNIILLSLIQGTIYSGIFSNGLIFLVSLSFIPSNIIRVLIPYLYKHPFDKNKKKFQFTYDIYTKFFAIISFYLFIMIFIFSQDIILTIYGEKYRATIDVLRIISFSIPFAFSVSSAMIISLDKQKYITVFLGIAVIIDIIANLILIKLFKAEGASAAVVITRFTLYFLTNGFLVKNRFVKFKNTFLTLLKISAICLVIFFIYKVFLFKLFFIFSAALLTAVFFILIYLFVLTDKDIRVAKETVGL